MPNLQLKEFGIDAPDAYLLDAAQATASGDYGYLFEESARLHAAGADRAHFTPFTQLAVDTSLAFLRHPEVAPQLPLEIKARYEVAAKVSGIATENMVARDEVTAWYQGTDLYAGMDIAERGKLTDTHYLQSLPSGAFNDSSTLAGGAFRLLEEKGISPQDRPGIIKGSSGLLYPAKIMKAYLKEAYDRLGKPYVQVSNLALDDRRENLRVRFTAEILTMLRNAYGTGEGCPLGRIAMQDASGNLLQRSWADLVSYLVPIGATADEYTEAAQERQLTPLVQ